MMGRGRRLALDERGSVTVLTAGCLFVVMVMCLFLADVGQYLAARHRVQDAADAAALAAVQESFPLLSNGGSPRDAAARLASSNGASLEEVRVSPGGERVVVEVSLKPGSALLGRLGIGPGEISARAAAEVDFESLISSGRLWPGVTPADMAALKRIIEGGIRLDGSGPAVMVVMLALSHLGEPYVWGAQGPHSFDCSGLTWYVHAQLGVELPRTTYGQVTMGRPVGAGELRSGDLVFFRGNAHVGIYVGNGWFVHAPHTGDVVRISPLAGRSISACRRIFQ